MSFKVTESPEILIVGASAPITVPSNPSGFPDMSNKKLEQLADFKNIKALVVNDALDNHFYAVNNASSGKPSYLVGVKSNRAIPNQESFLLPAGHYAIFTKTVKNRLEADEFIGASYGEVYQSEEFQINGAINLEVVDGFIQESPVVEFSVWIPVLAKTAPL